MERGTTDGCDLCFDRRVTRHYFSDSTCRIEGCPVCGRPRVVLKRHTMQPTPAEVQHMHDVCQSLFPGSRWQNYISSKGGHWHEHIITREEYA